MTELRAPLVAGLEHLVNELIVGSYGDPHVAFVVLVYPEREPVVVAVTDARPGAHDVAVLRARRSSTSSAPASRFFSTADLGDAVDALHDAEYGMHTYNVRSNDMELGMHLAGTIREGWARRRARIVAQTLAASADDGRLAEQCETCGRRLTSTDEDK